MGKITFYNYFGIYTTGIDIETCIWENLLSDETDRIVMCGDFNIRNFYRHNHWKDVSHPIIVRAIQKQWQLATEGYTTRKGAWGQSDSSPDLIFISHTLMEGTTLRKYIDRQGSDHYPFSLYIPLSRPKDETSWNLRRRGTINAKEVRLFSMDKLQNLPNDVDYEDLTTILTDYLDMSP